MPPKEKFAQNKRKKKNACLRRKSSPETKEMKERLPNQRKSSPEIKEKKDLSGRPDLGKTCAKKEI